MSDSTLINGGSVLLVDDDELVLKLASRTLARSGFEIQTAPDGHRALQCLLERLCHVLVADIRMPDMNGVALIRQALLIRENLSVIVITGAPDAEELEEVAQLGVAEILGKPFAPHQLLAAVHRQMERTQLIDASRPSGLQRYQEHIRQLLKITTNAIGADTYLEAMRILAANLRELFPSRAIGILEVTEAEGHLFVSLNAKQDSDGVGKELAEGLIERFESLTGRLVDRRLLQERTEFNAGHSGGDREAAASTTSLLLPFLGEGEVRGILGISDFVDELYRDPDLPFLYLLASRMHPVFRALHRMNQLAFQDGLTSLFNRPYMDEALQRAIDLCRRYGNAFGVLLLDVDGFKQINDSAGHMGGDDVLRELGRLMQALVRESDLVGRFGGDEFVILLPETDAPGIRGLCARILDTVGNHVFSAMGTQIPVRVTVGGAAIDSDAVFSMSVQDVLARTDEALYAAKRRGKACYAIWEKGGIEGEADLRTADEGAVLEETQPTRRAPHVLVVDDDEAVNKLLCLRLQKLGYETTACHTCKDALTTMGSAARNTFDVLLTDLNLPDGRGVDLINDFQQIDDRIVRIAVTGDPTVDSAVDCLRGGAFDLIQKPVNPAYLQAAMERAMNYRKALVESQAGQLDLEQRLQGKSLELSQTLRDLRYSYTVTLEALMKALDARGKESGQHSIRVREFSTIIGREMGLTHDKIEILRAGALLHDIGKIGVPDAILNKPGPLTDEEMTTMRRHSAIGHEILTTVPWLKEAAEIVYSHHENYDGTGYPRGLSGQTICLGARIFNVVDSYDAMRAARVYKPSRTAEDAREEVLRCSGAQFDPAVVDVFLRCIPEVEETWEQALVDGAVPFPPVSDISPPPPGDAE